MSVLRIIIVFFLLGPSLAIAGSETHRPPELPTGAKAELLAHCPTLDSSAVVATGDLDGDGVVDVAAIVRCPEKDLMQKQLVVLLGATDGHFHIAAASVPWEPHMRREDFVEIKGRTIKLSSSVHTYVQYAITTYKFARRDDAFILIGLDVERGRKDSDADTYSMSANLLTNKVAELSKSTKTGARKRTIRSLTSNYIIPLADFSLEESIDAESLR